MKLSKSRMALTGLYFLASPLVMAADNSTINITGNVIASPCVVDATNSVMNIKLDDIQATALSTAGSYSPWKTFSITLASCPASTTNVDMVLSGSQDPQDATRYKNTGAATNLSIELADNAGTNLGNGKKSSVAVNSTTKQAVFTLKTRAYSATGSVMPGSIAGTVLATFTYR
ncbi:putative fimbrial protein SthD [Serratia fonticola]|uniref:fimbrial protein n=1 Tax=Serratia fonticola TaxID=47917 RepID=UPI002177730B|nr:fimbrial protein [Serratia fonticola]CAI1652283.1 putative fimbrial protein SthD [Serratia fonticola]